MLEQELEYFERNLSAWLTENQGRFALVHGQELVGMFNTNDDALSEGARQFGLSSFLIRPVLPSAGTITAPALTLGLLRAHSPHTSSV